MKKFLIFFFLFTIYYFFLPKYFSSPVLAVKYSLVAPPGPFNRGQEIQFTINIDTQGATIRTGVIGMTYETQYLEYVRTTTGNAMTSVSTDQLGEGKLLFSGENTAGFTGQDVFAYVTFKLIAQAPGETTLCVLWEPSPSPTSPPEAPPPTTAPGTAAPTSPPQVTNLPTSGEIKKAAVATFFGSGFLVLFSFFYFLNKKIVFKKPIKKS